MRALQHYEYHHAPDSMCVSRPVRRPSEQEARRDLALDLTRWGHGPRLERAGRIQWLPLMDVALNGVDGLDIAASRNRSRAA